MRDHHALGPPGRPLKSQASRAPLATAGRVAGEKPASSLLATMTRARPEAKLWRSGVTKQMRAPEWSRIWLPSGGVH
jgi:hypothetical protein